MVFINIQLSKMLICDDGGGVVCVDCVCEY